ncbi:uncharacterized protein LOC134456746 [Engraulis encrasicolus]|uniref:uncharacterized protein LOC134456746 n=1 Tax=Engraulis encrasicolus TaxID=184585 RepID=UPI002FCF11AB
MGAEESSPESSERSTAPRPTGTSTATVVSAEDHSVDRRVFISDHSVRSNVNIQNDHSVRNDFSIRDRDCISGEDRLVVTTDRAGNNVSLSGVSGVTGNINIGTHIGSGKRKVDKAEAARQPRTIRIYYSEKLMERGDFVEEGREGEEQGEGGGGGGGRGGRKPKFTGTLPFLTVSVPPRKIKYVSVCLEGSGGECDKMIVENFNVSNKK